MTEIGTRPIVSGRAYPVLEVNDHKPGRLKDFLGTSRFLLDTDGTTYPVYGCGRQVDDGVRFYQKDAGGQGKDIRVWVVRPADQGGFVAEHVIH